MFVKVVLLLFLTRADTGTCVPSVVATFPNVFIDSGLSHAHVNQTLHESLEQIDQFESMADLIPIPLITLGLATYRNYRDFDTGQTSSKQYLENIHITKLMGSPDPPC